ncbi:MAG: hypothetical protein B6U76_02850 [Desulfurococcales archaeon ex4484_217_2]|nr:MAG: hypothetical protein B6U76_02850 [Desulfurococcales archaeon ex4484_217_2]
MKIWSISMRERSSSWIEDFILLAFFFVAVYAMVYIALRLSSFSSMEELLNILRSPIMTIVYFVLGIVTGIAGIKEIYFGIYRRGNVSLGFALVFVSAMFFLTFYFLSVNMLVNTLNKLVTSMGI